MPAAAGKLVGSVVVGGAHHHHICVVWVGGVS